MLLFWIMLFLIKSADFQSTIIKEFTAILDYQGANICMANTKSNARTVIVTTSRLVCALKCLRSDCLIFSYSNPSGMCVLTKSLYEGLSPIQNCITYQFGKSNRLVIVTPPSPFVYIPNTCNNPFPPIAGWQVVQRRCSGAVDFYRTWANYANGFGDVNGEFWIGNEELYRMTSASARQLRVDIQTPTGVKAYAVYSSFQVESAATSYTLQISGYSGNAGDSFGYSNGRVFSTYDVNNVGNCAVMRHTGNWVGSCLLANPNGLYGSTAVEGGVNWYYYESCNTCSYPYFQMRVF